MAISKFFQTCQLNNVFFACDLLSYSVPLQKVSEQVFHVHQSCFRGGNWNLGHKIKVALSLSSTQ